MPQTKLDFKESEQNPAPRVPLKFGVQFRRTYGRNFQSGLLFNVSLTGAFLKCAPQDIKPNDRIELSFNVGGRTRKLSSHIIWINQHGCGVRFIPTSQRDSQIIDDLIYFISSRRENQKSVLDLILKEAA